MATETQRGGAVLQFGCGSAALCLCGIPFGCGRRLRLDDVSADRRESEESRKRAALESFGMWSDRSPDTFLEDSRSALKRRDEELEDARVDTR